jgi:CDP-diacylglycerol--serine O-phosphatidyltransferase
MFLYDKNSHFNLANLFTFANITAGVLALYFISESNFFYAALFAWIGGAFDIFDGKIARKYNLSTEFGVQLDSFADFLSFVLVPIIFIYFAIFKELMSEHWLLVGVVSIYYIICGLRRLVAFNLNNDAGSLQKYFVGVPTPLGAILLWVLYLLNYFNIINSIYIVAAIIALIGYLLNSKIKVKHP